MNEKPICSLEEWDYNLDYYLPNMSSKSWKDNFKLPLIFGNSFFDSRYDTFIELITPKFLLNYVDFTPIELIGDNPHLYLVLIYSYDFFEKNKEFGFSNISEKYKNDIRNNKCKIVLMMLYEGNSGMEGNNDLKIIENWCLKENFRFDSIYYINGNLIIKSIVERDKIRINVKSIQFFEKWNETRSTSITFNPINNKNLYLCYNRQPRNNRIFIVNELIEKKLFDRGLLSLNSIKYEFIKPSYMTDETFNFIKQNLPFRIDLTNLDVNQARNLVTIDYEKTFISIVTETLVQNDTLFITEKTWKPIIMGHPFMIYGNKNTLKYLKNLGYKTFDKWIDESYDIEDDYIIRAGLIVREIEKFSKFTIDELKIIRKEMLSICDYNRMHFINLINKNYNGYTKIELISMLNEIWNELIKNITIKKERKII